jgi:tRNA pseudouridine13 synthase
VACFRPAPDTFTVEEIPAYLPSGTGEHTYLWLEKRSLTTLHAVGELARRLAVPAREIGYAGMKDRHATTRQWVSLPRIDPAVALEAGSADLRVLRAARHNNKLRVGHLRGNRFSVAVTDLEDAAEGAAIRVRLSAVIRDGLPNRYGEQRFGVTSQNVSRGLALLRGETRERDHRRRKLLLSAVQSAVFNQVLARRQAAQQLRRVLAGDILQKTDSGGVFYTDDPVQDQLRLDAGAVVVTGPMPGGWALEPATGTEARAIEDQAMAEVGVRREDFTSFGRDLPGTRRPLLVAVTADDLAAAENFSAMPADSTTSVRLSFQLPAGTYATVLLAALGVSIEQHRSRIEPSPLRDGDGDSGLDRSGEGDGAADSETPDA